MASFVVILARGLVLALVAVSGIVSIYEATNAFAIHSGYSVFASGLLMVAAAALVNPLFCFIANYGLLRYGDVPLGQALALTLPCCLAWCFAIGRRLLASAR